MTNFPRIILAGTNSGVGKTTVTIGLMLALKKKGLEVAPFKTGPDYIDTAYHFYASQRSSCNLDTWMLPKDAVLELFLRNVQGCNISIIEGVMGLYDGLEDTQRGSTAYLAKLLNCPVILIINARSLSRSAAAVALGFKQFDKQLKISGIILNNIGSPNHFRYIKSVIESKTGIPVLGFLPHSPELRLPERHLGLAPAWERKLESGFLNRLSNLINRNMNLSLILDIARSAPSITLPKKTIFNFRLPRPDVTIAIAKDKAFNFYYQDNLEILKHLGAKVIEFSPLKDKELPKNIDGLYIGGGYPELFASKLAQNTRLKKEIYQRAEQSLPIYAECGGLMYLAKELIDFKKRRFPMTGIFKCATRMGKGHNGLGYVELQTRKDNILSKRGESLRGHIFHWSFLDNIPKDSDFAYRIKKNSTRFSKKHDCFAPSGLAMTVRNKVFYDGLIRNNVLASYAHLHFASNLNIAKNFINRCKSYRDAKKTK